jgi:hypothetical protein
MNGWWHHNSIFEDGWMLAHISTLGLPPGLSNPAYGVDRGWVYGPSECSDWVVTKFLLRVWIVYPDSIAWPSPRRLTWLEAQVQYQVNLNVFTLNKAWRYDLKLEAAGVGREKLGTWPSEQRACWTDLNLECWVNHPFGPLPCPNISGPSGTQVLPSLVFALPPPSLVATPGLWTFAHDPWSNPGSCWLLWACATVYTQLHLAWESLSFLLFRPPPARCTIPVL